MKTALLRWLVSRAGGILTPVIAGLVGLGVARLAALSPELASSVDQVAVTGFVVTGILALVNYLTNSAQSDGVKRIQAVVGTKQDGVPGPVTYIEVRRAVAAAEDRG